MRWLAVAAGGALGSLARYGVNHAVHAVWPALRFPAGIALINVAGCFAIGVLAALLASGRIHATAAWRDFVFVGLLGGFTTFSSFGIDTLALGRSGAMAYAIANVLLQVAGGLAAVWIGFRIGESTG